MQVVLTFSSPARHITPLAFLRRLTTAEEVAIDIASIDDPTADAPTRAQQAALRAAIRRLTTARFVDLDDPETLALTDQLEASGLIAAGRAAQIVGAEVQPQEMP